jgi:hypothetical protein
VATRAGQLRDAMSGGLSGVPAGRPDIRAPARTGGHTAVLLEPQGPATELLDSPSGPEDGWPPGGSPAAPFAGGWRPAAPQPGRRAAARWPGRRGWVAALAAAMLVALAGWLRARAGGGPAQPPVAAATHRASPGPGTHGPATVSVNAAALLGRPVGTVREYLAGLGLRPRVVRSVTGAQPPGTVVSVHPSGRVAEGSIITVAAAVAPSDHRHHHGKAEGTGDGGGDGGSGHGGG